MQRRRRGLVYDGNNDGVVGSGDRLQLLTEFGQTCTPSPAALPSLISYEYATVLIGEQCWLRNLRSTQYTNGDSLIANLTAPNG